MYVTFALFPRKGQSQIEKVSMLRDKKGGIIESVELFGSCEDS